MPDAAARLAPKSIAKTLFIIDPDRDERASQLFMEALLTIAQNGYVAPAGDPTSPKVRRFAIRSLVLGNNFLQGQTGQVGGGAMTMQEYGQNLADARDFQGADNLALARTALESLIDPSTQQGQKGQHLLLPFHESLLWYDARQAGPTYTARKVRMRGSGLTFARMVLDPPDAAGADARRNAQGCLAGLRDALRERGPLAEIANGLEGVLPDLATASPPLEDDERQAWELGASTDLAPFAAQFCRHANGVTAQGGASAPARLWQLRAALGLDMAVHSLRRAWGATGAPARHRYVLLAMPGPDRQGDRVRLRSEKSYADARASLRWATIETLAARMRELGAEPGIDWAAEFEPRTSRLLRDAVITPLGIAGRTDHRALAQLAFEAANYDRSGEGFRVLLDSIGVTAGGSRYRYLSASPDLMAALVGALSAEMPLPSSQFFRRIAQEWGLVISADAAIGTTFGDELDGPDLVNNARRFERLMIDAGLAADLSDRTVMVGERAMARA